MTIIGEKQYRLNIHQDFGGTPPIDVQYFSCRLSIVAHRYHQYAILSYPSAAVLLLASCHRSYFSEDSKGRNLKSSSRTIEVAN